MKFFKDLKRELEEHIEDFTTVEHALIEQNSKGETEVVIYRKHEIDGDSVFFLSSKEIETQKIEAFNELFQASIVSRLGILQAIIKIFK